MPQKDKILIVDDEPRMRDSLSSMLENNGYEIFTAGSGKEAISLMENNSLDIALIDYVLPDILGYQLIKTLHQKNPDTIAIIMTGNASLDSAVKALREGAYDYLKKPFEITELTTTIQNGLSKKKLMTENRSIHKQLEASQRHYQYLVNNSPDIIYTVNQKGYFTFVNNSIEELIGMKPKQIIGNHYSKIIKNTNTYNCKWIVNERRTGKRAKKRNELKLLKFDPYGKPKKELLFAEFQSTGMYKNSDNSLKNGFVGTHGVIRDITERKVAEIRKKEMKIQLEHARKMEAVGTVASAVAHDLNNLLTSFIIYPDLILMEMKKDDPLREYLIQIENSGRKAAVMVKDLLTLSRRRIKVSNVVNLDQIIQDYLLDPQYLELKFRYPEVTFTINLNSKNQKILGSPVHLSKCISNLIANATESMPNGGNIEVLTKTCLIDKKKKTTLNIKPGKYIQLVVSDTGMGISQKEIKKVFDPFYTTKKMGRSGTGLGMTIVWTTVKDHNAYIDVKSKLNKGTTFTLFFPITNKQKKMAPELKIGIVKGKMESILIVDDIPEQREIASTILSKMGYKTDCVSSGEEGIEFIKSNHTDLIFLDMVLGSGLDGLDTYKEMKKLNPAIKVIIVSGSPRTERINKAIALGARNFIRKPYSTKTILSSIQKEIKD